MLRGAGLGTLGGAAFGAIGVPNSLWKVGAYAAVGGGLSELGGGDFETGALMAGGAALCAYGYNKLFKMPLDGRVATEDADLKREQKPGYYRNTDNTKNSLFGKAGCTGFLCEGNPKMEWAAKNVRYVQQGSVAHDWTVDISPKALQSFVLLPTIPPAVAWTIAGGLAVYAPVSAPVALGFCHDDR